MTRTRWYIRRIPLNRKGYDRAGQYYGVGKPLWECYSADGRFDFRIRGHRDYARCAYLWARAQKDTANACRHLEYHGAPLVGAYRRRPVRTPTYSDPLYSIFQKP